MKKLKILFIKGEKKNEMAGIGKYSAEIIKILKKKHNSYKSSSKFKCFN